MTYANPFRYRASEQQRDVRSFLRSFGPGALTVLPEALWDRLVVLRSAPGAGKTSLMRVFGAESAHALTQDRDTFGELAEALERLGGADESGPKVLGAYLNLERDYRALMDVGPVGAANHRLFFRLLDARIMVAVMKSALTLRGLAFPDEIGSVKIRVTDEDASVAQAREQLGGTSGTEIYERCRSVERDMLRMLDSLLPVDWEQHGAGHSDLHSLRLLSSSDILIDDQVLGVRPLVMLDDGHRLHPAQRTALLDRLVDRGLNVARWYSERYQALSREDLMDQLGTEGRDFELVELESVARGAAVRDGRPRFAPGQFEKILMDIAVRRAHRSLTRSLDEQEDDFRELLQVEDDELLGDSPEVVVGTVRARVEGLAAGDRRYVEWINAGAKLSGYQAALRWRELEVLIRRDRDRAQGDLFSEPLSATEAKERSSSGIREAVATMLAREFDLPYYAGPEQVAKLGSHNVEQFLTLSGDLFAEMMAAVTLQRKPRVAALRQHRICRRASQRFWREIPRRVPDGHLVQRFVAALMNMAKLENDKATVAYPPGVTGTALLMSDRERLLDPSVRERVRGADQLLSALSNAIAYNVVSAELDRRVKNKQVMVVYVNRLLCPLFWLPLGRGGYREKKLEAMAQWMTEPAEGGVPDESEQLSF